jgi:phosphoribosylformylglycinamidine synthase subunit PurS
VKYEVLVEVKLRPGIADPQGATIERALPALGFQGVDDVSVGKAFRLSIDASDETGAHDRAVEMADRLLANPVIEVSTVTVLGPMASAATPATASAAAPATAHNGAG